MDPCALNIVCYTGGTCGDLISALIDSTDAEFEFGAISHVAERQRLKKPHTFADNEEKDRYIIDISTKYLSIPSHDLDYHVARAHKFIAITVQDFSIAMWAANRFRSMHSPHVWEEMQSNCGANSIEDYAQMLIHYSNMVVNHTGNIVKLEDILAGQAIDSLEKLGIGNLDKNLYLNWLNLQNNTFRI
jgi:hypothetical protein